MNFVQIWREMFPDLKDSFKYRSFMFLFLLRRSLFVMILIFLQDQSIYAKIGLISLVQIPYFALIAFLRPFRRKKENVIEWMNEVVYCVLYLSLSFLHSRSAWTKPMTNWYVWVITLNNIGTWSINCGTNSPPLVFPFHSYFHNNNLSLGWTIHMLYYKCKPIVVNFYRLQTEEKKQN